MDENSVFRLDEVCCLRDAMQRKRNPPWKSAKELNFCATLKAKLQPQSYNQKDKLYNKFLYFFKLVS